MTLWPFNRKKEQQTASLTIIILSLILIFGLPLTVLENQIKTTGFAIGVILGIISLIYYFDSLP